MKHRVPPRSPGSGRNRATGPGTRPRPGSPAPGAGFVRHRPAGSPAPVRVTMRPGRPRLGGAGPADVAAKHSRCG